MIIGPSQYSKDPGLMAEGIAVTLPVAFFDDRGTDTASFKKMFTRFMAQEDALWNFKLTNLPARDIAWVYLIWDRHIQCRLNFVQYERNVSKEFKDAPDGRVRRFENANWIIMCGPVVWAPHPMEQKGFQGFRYTTKLF